MVGTVALGKDVQLFAKRHPSEGQAHECAPAPKAGDESEVTVGSAREDLDFQASE